MKYLAMVMGFIIGLGSAFLLDRHLRLQPQIPKAKYEKMNRELSEAQSLDQVSKIFFKYQWTMSSVGLVSANMRVTRKHSHDYQTNVRLDLSRITFHSPEHRYSKNHWFKNSERTTVSFLLDDNCVILEETLIRENKNVVGPWFIEGRPSVKSILAWSKNW